MRDNKTALLAFEALVRSRRVIAWFTDGRARPLHVSFRVCFFLLLYLGEMLAALCHLCHVRGAFCHFISLSPPPPPHQQALRVVLLVGPPAAARGVPPPLPCWPEERGARSKPAEWETRLCVVSCVRVRATCAHETCPGR